MWLAHFGAEIFVANSLRKESETAVEGLDSDELSLFAVDQVDMGLTELLSVG
jgi:hypothetical protein